MASINEIKALASRKGGFAQSSQFLVKLPDIGFYNTRDLNILCKTISLPGRQILTNDRIIGVKQTKVAYGFAAGPVSMTFQVLNDYGVKEYFELWQNKIVNNNNFSSQFVLSFDDYLDENLIFLNDKIKKFEQSHIDNQSVQLYGIYKHFVMKVKIKFFCILFTS